ncbi:MAG: MBOAT family protein [Halioglobus sp.]|nr:MBOAT family protein [Halioglobus sp.]
MLFNSYEFIFLFLPVCVAGYFVCARYYTLNIAYAFLVLASLFFYAWWKPIYLVLILFSIGFNFAVGRLVSREGRWKKRGVLVFGITVNLVLLGYFKYANFFVDNVNAAFGSDWDIETIFLPLAISFFTFQQIAYLVDAWRGETSEYNFLHYCLFVSFFPQLIAGPIVHHKDILPQFMRGENMSPQWSNFAVGISIFSIGLFKKTVLADSLSSYVGPVFDTDNTAGGVDFFRAWGASLAYTFQLYFDFSGYSDMAIGVARLFGVRLPINFFSPLKSTSMIEMWHRWHMTLSRFLREYLYIALGGNRKGSFRRYVNLLLTMLLGGLWHGAGWPFVVWGGLQGCYLIINHGWRHFMKTLGWNPSLIMGYREFCWVVTFFAWVISFVFFRAPTLERGSQIVQAMLGMSGFEIPAGMVARTGGFGSWLLELGFVAVHGGGAQFVTNYIWVLISAAIVLTLPNVAQIFNRYEPVLYESDRAFSDIRGTHMFSWRYSNRWAFAVALGAVAGILTLQQVSEFLYFQF